MGLTVRNHAREIMALRRAMMNRQYEEGENGWQRIARLPVDIYATDDEIIVNASMPGIDPDSVEISIEDKVLTIEGELPAHAEDVDYLFAERFHGKFRRSLKLNVAIDEDDVEASFENGILTLVLPKAEEAKPKQIKVQTK